MEKLYRPDHGGWQGNISKTFAITSIPKNIVVSKDGNIVAIDIWGDDLQRFLLEKKLYK